MARGANVAFTNTALCSPKVRPIVTVNHPGWTSPPEESHPSVDEAVC